jgi:hypothetical protein
MSFLDLKGAICIFSNIHCSSIFWPRLFEPAASIILRCQTQPFSVTLFILHYLTFQSLQPLSLYSHKALGSCQLFLFVQSEQKTGNDFRYLATILDLRINIAIFVSKRFHILYSIFNNNNNIQYFLLPVIYFASCQDFSLCSAEWRNGGMAGE